MKITPAENFPQMAQNAASAYDTTGIAGVSVSSNTPLDGQVISYNSNTNQYEPTTAGGTVTSVAMTVPAEFSISGSPITSSGTLAITKANETANTVWAGPTSGGAAVPTFRALVTADVPAGGGSPLTTKGDVYTYSTVNARLAVGTDGQSLTAASAQTTGLTWMTHEVLMVDGITSPPEPVTNEAGTDWLYEG